LARNGRVVLHYLELIGEAPLNNQHKAQSGRVSVVVVIPLVEFLGLEDARRRGRRCTVCDVLGDLLQATTGGQKYKEKRKE
jgi:hypothetical protein